MYAGATLARVCDHVQLLGCAAGIRWKADCTAPLVRLHVALTR